MTDPIHEHCRVVGCKCGGAARAAAQAADDPRASIIGTLADALGIPVSAFSGIGDESATIEANLHPYGGNHRIAWSESGYIRGSLTITPAATVFADGAHCSTWAPPITVDTPTIAAAVLAAAGELAELLEAMKSETVRMRIIPRGDGTAEFTPIDADGNPRGETSVEAVAPGSLAAAALDAGATDAPGTLAAETVAIGPECFATLSGDVLCWRDRNYIPQDQYRTMAHELDQWRSYAGELARVLESMDVDASTLAALAIVAPDAVDAAHCEHGRIYPDCALCHRTAGGAPKIDDMPGLRSDLMREVCGPAEAAVKDVLNDPSVTNLDTLVHQIVEAARPHITPGGPRRGVHLYRSTGCLHGDHVLDDGRTGHEYCQSDTGHAGSKRAGRCKFCDAACVCPCHTGGTK